VIDTENNIFDKVSKKAVEKGISINLLESRAGVSTGSIYKWNTVSPTVLFGKLNTASSVTLK